jgi:hypothetical protein
LVALLSNPEYLRLYQDDMTGFVQMTDGNMQHIITDACHLAHLMDKVTDKILD